MPKIKIRIVVLGHLPHAINLDRIFKWQSDLFQVDPLVSTFNIDGDSDGAEW